MKKVPWYTSTTTIISILAFAIIWLGLAGWINIPNPPQTTHTGQSNANEGVSEEGLDEDIVGLATVEYNKTKTTCFTGIECKGAYEQNIQVGDVAMAGVPFGTRVKVLETGYIYTVATRPDSKTEFDIFYGYSQDDYERCLERGVKYYTIEILND